MEILSFEIADRRFAVRSSEVKEVLRAVALWPLAEASDLWEGALNLRGRIIPVLDLRALFRSPPKPIDPADHLIVLELAANEAGPRMLAVRADRAMELTQVEDARLEKIADSVDVFSGGGAYVDKVFEADGVLMHLLAPERFPELKAEAITEDAP